MGLESGHEGDDDASVAPYVRGVVDVRRWWRDGFGCAMEQPNTTNSQPEQSLDDDVESLLASVKATEVEAPADSGDGDASPIDDSSAIDPALFASDDAAGIADILNAQHDQAEAYRKTAADGDDSLQGPAKINGDTAAIDAQLDVLTRQAAELAEMAQASTENADADALNEHAAPSDAAVSEAAPSNAATSNAAPSDVAPSDVAQIEEPAAVQAATQVPSDALDADEASVDVANLMSEVAAEVGSDANATPGTLPTNAEDAAALAAEMLAKATAAVNEVTVASAGGTEAQAAPEIAAEVPNQIGDDASVQASEGNDDAASLDGLLANLDTPAPEQLGEDASPAPSEQPLNATEAVIDSHDDHPIQSIKSLDEQIAQLSDDLLNEPSQVDSILPPTQPDPIAAATTAASDAMSPTAAAGATPTASTGAPAPEAAAVTQVTPTAHVAPATQAASTPAASAPQAAPASRTPESGASESSAAESSAAESESIVAPSKPSVSMRERLSPIFSILTKSLGAVAGLITPVLGAMSAPLAKKPRIVRDSIGWIAVNTVFCASCLWGYMLFLRPAQIAERHAAFDLAHAELPQVPGHAAHDPHAAGADTHGAEGGGGHEAPKDDGHGAKKDDRHGGGGGGHGGGHGDAKAGPKKAAYKPPSRKPPTKAERAKAKPKDDGHGGGGGGGH